MKWRLTASLDEFHVESRLLILFTSYFQYRMAVTDVLKRLKFDIDELVSDSPPPLVNETAITPKAGRKVLQRGFTDFLSENPTYSHENYIRRKKQRSHGFLAVDYIPYKSLGPVKLNHIDLVKESFGCDLGTLTHNDKYKVLHSHKEVDCPTLKVDETNLNCLQQKKPMTNYNEESEHDTPASLHGGLSHMRLVLGANQRRIYAQQFNGTDYKQALEHERERMIYLRDMWSHPPTDKGHHPSKYLNPMVHTSSSKECLLTRKEDQPNPPHHSNARQQGDPDEQTASDTPGTPGGKPPQVFLDDGNPATAAKVERRGRNNSFYVALAATSFKRTPARAQKRVKKIAEEQMKLDNMLFKLSSLCRILNALTNVRNRDLRSKHPVSSEALKLMMSKPSESFVLGDYNSSHRHHKYRSSPSYLHPATSNFSKIGSPGLVSRPTSNSLVKNSVPANLPKTPLPFVPVPGSHPHSSLHHHQHRNVNFGGQTRRMAVDDDGTLGWDDLMHLHSTMPTKPHHTRSTFANNVGRFYGPPTPSLRPSKESPLWQRPIVCPVQGHSEVNKSSPLPEDQILSAKRAFEETKAKSSLKFKEKLTEFEDDTEQYFIQTLKELHLGPLVGTSLNRMRTRAHENIQNMKMKEDNKPMWFLKLEKEANQLPTQRNNEKLQHLFKKLRQFDELSELTVPNLKEKLCLIVMSLPAYVLAQEHMVAAVSFILSEMLMTSRDLLNLWVNTRRLPLLLRTGTQNVMDQSRQDIKNHSVL